MEKARKNWLIGISILITSMLIVSVTISLFGKASFLDSLRIIFGSIYVLFLPGFIISYIFFPKTKEFDDRSEENLPQGIDWIERIALSFALSIAIVPLAIFYLNLIGIKINLINSFLAILAIIIFSLGIWWWKEKR